MLMEKYKEGQKELHCAFVDLEKACNQESKLASSEKRAVVLYEKIRNGGKVCVTCTVCVEGKQNSGKVCSRNYRKFQGQGQVAPGISVNFVSV